MIIHFNKCIMFMMRGYSSHVFCFACDGQWLGVPLSENSVLCWINVQSSGQCEWNAGAIAAFRWNYVWDWVARGANAAAHVDTNIHKVWLLSFCPVTQEFTTLRPMWCFCTAWFGINLHILLLASEYRAYWTDFYQISRNGRHMSGDDIFYSPELKQLFLMFVQVYSVVDEMFLAGEIRETSQTKVLKQLLMLSSLE